MAILATELAGDAITAATTAPIRRAAMGFSPPLAQRQRSDWGGLVDADLEWSLGVRGVCAEEGARQPVEEGQRGRCRGPSMSVSQ